MSNGISSGTHLRGEVGDAVPSSLIPVHKLDAYDYAYETQLARDAVLANAHVAHEVTVGSSDRIHTDKTFEGESMRSKVLFAAMGLAAVPSSCFAASFASNKDDARFASGHVAEVEDSLSGEYQRIKHFVDFRKKLVADGWIPVVNPDCENTVAGGDYARMCAADPDDVECRLCAIVPELHRHTSDGYNIMRYAKNGSQLAVTVFGDTRDLDEPGEWGLFVRGWSSTDLLNVVGPELEGFM